MSDHLKAICPVCGEPQDSHGHCQHCLDMMRDLGIPEELSDRMRCIYTQIGDVVDQDGTPFARESQYMLYVFGVWFDTVPDDGPWIPVNGHPFYDYDDERWYTAPIGGIQAWLTRVQPVECSLYAQRKWRPGREASCEIRGFQRKHTRRDRQMAEHALERLAESGALRRGRPRRDEALAIEIASLHDDHHLTYKQIAQRFDWPLSPDEHATPRRSARATDYTRLGRRLRGTEKTFE